MSGVNDLADEWRTVADRHELNNPNGLALDGAARRDCASDLDGLREDVWRPVSQPPSAEKHGDHDGMVAIWVPFAGFGVTHPNKMDGLPDGAYWARIRDVVLIPPQGGE